jgi:hypothetical protein
MVANSRNNDYQQFAYLFITLAFQFTKPEYLWFLWAQVFKGFLEDSRVLIAG